MSRAASLLMCSAICALAQTAPMALLRSRYEIRAGEPARIAAPAETLDFLLHAKTRRVSIAGMETSGLVAGPNYARDQILLAPSLRAQPGEYTITLSATSETGEERRTTLAVVVKPQATVPASSTRPPVVLVNGWMTGFTNSCPISTISTTFGNLAEYLTKQDGVPVVYLFDNCAVDQGSDSIETLGNDLGAFLKTIKYDSGAQVPQIDLVAHSMGGLIARAYLAGIQPNQTFLPPAPTLVRKLALIATPNFGSFVAGNYIYSVAAGSQSAELAPGSAFLWNLNTWNQRGDDLRGVDAIAVVGNAGSYMPNLSSSYVLNNASDGLVSLTSASLGFAYGSQSSATRVVPYCHIDPSAFTNAGLGTFACNAPGIANVTDTLHPTGQIVRSFLAGTTAWSSNSLSNPPASDPYLVKNGGMFFAMMNGAGNYVTDMSTVSWGTVPLQNSGNTGTIFYTDFASGTGTLMATSQSLSTINCGSLAQAPGYSWAARCKIGAVVFSVTPLASTSGRVLSAGTTVTLNGANLGSQCSGCQVLAYPAGSGTAQALTVTSWQSSAISVKLPASLTGLLTLKVVAAGGAADTIGIMAAAPTTIAVIPASLEFAYTAGGTVPAAQPIQISNSGTGTATLSWTAKASDSWLSVSAASGTAPSTPSVSVSPAGLSAGTYNGAIQISAAGASNSPLSIAVTLTVAPAQPAVTVTAVVNAGSYQPGIASGAWISVFGTNLSPSTYLWQASDIVNGALPTLLQGVSVTVNGLPAYVDYVSPTQINALVPDDDTLGPVPVQVTAAGVASNIATVQKSLFAPAFLTFDGTHVAALHADYSPIGAPNLLPGAVTTPARPGEIILLYGVGFGPANPPQPTGQLVATAAPLAYPVQITIGGVAASVAYAGLTGSGLDQFNVTVPDLRNGDAAVVASISGVPTQTGVSLTVQQ